MDMQRSRKNK